MTVEVYITNRDAIINARGEQALGRTMLGTLLSAIGLKCVPNHVAMLIPLPHRFD